MGEPTGPAKPEEDDEFSDGRDVGNFKSHYPRQAWVQIALEGGYLLFLAAAAGTHLIFAAMPGSRWECPPLQLAADLPQTYSDTLRLWTVVFLSGVLGAVAFSLKWLYHTVARKTWHRDRLIWRLAVPLQGGLTATFLGAMIMAGIIPLLSKDPFSRVLTAAGFGFFVGLIADNFMAAIQKFANRTLGTLANDD